MDFTLERIRTVLARLGLARPRARVLTVGGTNGKGSVTTLLEALLREGGHRVGLYTSPHLVRYTERIRIDGREIDERRLIDVFERVEAARNDITLTFFEYATAAALLAFDEVAVVASIGLDHMDYLGDTLEAIGREKAGIFRAGRPALFGSLAMPDSIAAEAARIGAPLERLGHEFGFEKTAAGFDWWRGATRLAELPRPGLVGEVQYQNAATALAAIAAGGALPPSEAAARALAGVRLAGRFERRPGPVEWIFDVAHNGAAAEALAATMRERPPRGRWLLVAGVLADKDAAAIGRAVAPALRPGDILCTVGLPGERGRSAAALAAILGPSAGLEPVQAESVEAGCAFAAREARSGDAVLVFGSFLAVGPALEWHRLYGPKPHC